MASAVINTTGRTLSNGSTSYAPNTSRVSSSNGVSRVYSSGNVSSPSVTAYNASSQPGLGTALGNKSAEASGEIRAYNNELAQYLSDIAYERNVASAREAMQYNKYIQDRANAFNRESMKMQQDYNNYMSNTAHQREVKDLIAAGLNPVLSAHATGASTPSLTALSAGSAHGGVSANSPMATLDTNIYAANSLFDIVSDLIADFIMNKKGRNTAKNIAEAIKDNVVDFFDNISGKTAKNQMLDGYGGKMSKSGGNSATNGIWGYR